MSIIKAIRNMTLPAALILALLALSVAASAACNGDDDDDDSDLSSREGYESATVIDGTDQGIWVTGSGRASTPPDIATLRIGVEASDETVSDAMSDAADAMQAIIDSLTSAGIAEDDIRTLTFNVSQQYEWNDTLRRSEMVGFSVTNTVQATVRQLDMIAGVLDGAVRAGGDNARVDGLSFRLEDAAAAESEARTLAMQAAREQAQQLASLAGVELGEPFFIGESGAAPFVGDDMDMSSPARAFAADEAASTPILPGESDVVIYVRVGYEIS